MMNLTMTNLTMTDIVQRLLGWWNPPPPPPPPPPTPAFVPPAPVYVPSKCLPTVVFTAVPAPLSPVDAGADLLTLCLAFCLALSMTYYLRSLPRRLASFSTARRFFALVVCPLAGLIVEVDFFGLDNLLRPLAYGTLLATIRHDWAHAWPHGATAKSTLIRCSGDLATLLIKCIPHQIRVSLRDEIWTTSTYVGSLVTAVKSRSLLVSDLPVAMALLCFTCASLYCVHLAYNEAWTAARRARGFSEEDITSATLLRSMRTRSPKHRLFLKRLSRNRCKRTSMLDPPSLVPHILHPQRLHNQRVQSVRQRLYSKRAMEVELSRTLLSKRLRKELRRVAKGLQDQEPLLNEIASLKLPTVNNETQELRKAKDENAKLSLTNQGLYDQNAKVMDLNEKLHKSREDLDAKYKKLHATNVEAGKLLKEMNAVNDKLRADNTAFSKLTDELLDQVAKKEERTDAVVNQDEKLRELNTRLVDAVAKLRASSKEQEATIASLQESLATKTGTVAGASTDKGKGSGDGVSKEPHAKDGNASQSTDHPEDTNAGGDSGSPLIGKLPSTGHVEGDAPGEGDGGAGSSVDQSQDAACGSVPTPAQDPSTDQAADGDTESLAEKRRRRKKRGGTAVRAAKEAAWAKASGGDAE